MIRAHILDVCRRKLATFERFNARYPGFGGFLPWFHTDAATGGLAPQPPHWVDAVPSLDNGEMLWTMLALVHALRTTGETQLADGYLSCLFVSCPPNFFDWNEFQTTRVSMYCAYQKSKVYIIMIV